MQADLSQPKQFVTTDTSTYLWLTLIFNDALRIKRAMVNRHQNPDWQTYKKCLKGYKFANIFYEPSTRTRLSFAYAIMHLGGDLDGTEAAMIYSSAKKGESLADTIRTIAGYHVDAIILRHGTIGSAQLASDLGVTSIINAGDGAGEHPTQALLDWFTLWEAFKGRSDLCLTLVGDLKYGRTAHSLIRLACALRHTPLGFVSQVQLVAPKQLALPQSYIERLSRANITCTFDDHLAPGLMKTSDGVYMTRAQTERHTFGLAGKFLQRGLIRLGVKKDFASQCALTPALAEKLHSHSLIMHPLPRLAELPGAIDSCPQAHYFDQAGNGLYVRMALLRWMFGKLE